MKKRLFLDDFRMPLDAFNYTKDLDYLKDDWDIVRSYDEFVSHLMMYWKEHGKMPELISYDRDLADEHMDDPNKPASEYKEKTGEQCATWVVYFCVDNDLEMPKWKVHSQNPSGQKNIPLILTNDYEKLMSFKKNK